MKQILIAAAALLPAWSAANAQDVPTQAAPAAENSSGYRVRVGVGAQLRPKFPGARKDDIAPLLHVNIARGDHQFHFNAPDDSLALSVVNSGGFSFGPAVNLQQARKDKDVGLPLGKVKSTIEAGAFADYSIIDTLRIRAEVRKGLNGHKGVVGSVGVDKIWRDGDKYVFSIGPRLLFADGRYERAYFGVTPAAALRTGLPVYRPGRGIKGIALASGFSYQFDDRFGMFDYARFERLVGDAAKSPIVRRIGSRNQVSVGLGLSYTFRTGS